jgi:hypothetical protein
VANADCLQQFRRHKLHNLKRATQAWQFARPLGAAPSPSGPVLARPHDAGAGLPLAQGSFAAARRLCRPLEQLVANPDKCALIPPHDSEALLAVVHPALGYGQSRRLPRSRD